MNPDRDETIFISYMMLAKGKWKTKLKEIKPKELDDYKKKYRVLYHMTSDDYYRHVEQDNPLFN